MVLMFYFHHQQVQLVLRVVKFGYQDGSKLLTVGNVNIIEATCFMPLLKTIFTPNFNFEELYHSSHLVEDNTANKKVIA
jgi:hypothetical protein